MPDLQNEHGWTGVFTRSEAPGAMRNGTRCRKRVSDAGDTHAVGSLGTVLGSVSVPDAELKRIKQEVPSARDVAHCYFVEWDDMPRYAVGVADYKIEATR